MQRIDTVVDVTTFGNKFFKFMTGVLVGAITAVLVALIFAFVLTIGAVPDAFITVGAYFSLVISSCVCGFTTVLRLKDAGLINGAISGICYFFLYVIMTTFFGSTSFFSVSTIITFAICVTFGAVGGILAVNIRKY